MQVGCMLPIDGIKARQKFGLVLGCVGAFIALFVLNYIDFITKLAEYDGVDWDQ